MGRFALLSTLTSMETAPFSIFSRLRLFSTSRYKKFRSSLCCEHCQRISVCVSVNDRIFSTVLSETTMVCKPSDKFLGIRRDKTRMYTNYLWTTREKSSIYLSVMERTLLLLKSQAYGKQVRHLHCLSRQRNILPSRSVVQNLYEKYLVLFAKTNLPEIYLKADFCTCSSNTLTAGIGFSLFPKQLLPCIYNQLSRRQQLHFLCLPLFQASKKQETEFTPRMGLHAVEEFSLENAHYRAYIRSLVAEYGAVLENRLKGDSYDPAHVLFLETVSKIVMELESKYIELADLKSMLSRESDRELQMMAEIDVDKTVQKIQHLEWQLVDVLVGPEPADRNDVMLEVSPGVGGQEAMLFTSEIFEMYVGFASFKGWTFDMVDLDKSDLGGLRKASALITGLDVYKHLKLEAGVHRVQRMPKTDRSGRIHTSTMTVAVLPQPSQIDITVNPKDLHIDTFRASGAGGQHVNKTESAVRITHLPTGMVAECQQDRSQIKNKSKAMMILLARLYEKEVQEQEAALRKKRKLQVGSAGRSEKIRTYNYSQDRITDHRGPKTFHNVAEFLLGENVLDDLLQTLMMQSRLEVLQAMVEEFTDSSQKHNERK